MGILGSVVCCGKEEEKQDKRGVLVCFTSATQLVSRPAETPTPLFTFSNHEPVRRHSLLYLAFFMQEATLV